MILLVIFPSVLTSQKRLFIQVTVLFIAIKAYYAIEDSVSTIEL